MPKPAEHPDVVCAGVLVADVFVPPLERLPVAGELVATEDFLIDAGGCAANTATCLTRLGVSVAVTGAVGADIYGDFVAQDLTAKGIDTRALRRTETGTSKTVILPVRGEDRRYIHTFGANAEFRVEDIPRRRVRACRVLYVGGYLILPAFDPGRLAELFAFARQQGAVTVLDVVVTDGGGGWEALAPVLPHVDVFTPNDNEAQLLTGEDAAERQAQRLHEAGCQTALVTRGADGAVIADADGVTHVPGLNVEVVDGSGAGDAFAAGLIAGVLDGQSIADAARLGSAVGASACTRLGCTAGVTSRADADALLERT